ncbi:MAG: S8 family serine peptidase [Atopobiaceae bacterium]
MTRRHQFTSRLTASILSVLLAFALVPAGMLPASSVALATEGDDSASTGTRDLIAQAESDGSCVSGQALVVYHASGAAKGSTGEISIQSDSDPLADAGFSATSTWDLSAADSAAASSAAEADGALSVQSEATGTTLASGSDVRVALVERDDMSVADLVGSLEALDFVECASPDYVYQPSSLTKDTYSDLQYNLSGSVGGIDEQTALTAETSGTSDNVIAVLDTGIDFSNPDLAGVAWSNPGGLGLGPAGTHGYNSVTGAYDPTPDYSNTELPDHGTHCAGIVAAQANNATGVAGVAGTGHTKIMGLCNDCNGTGMRDINSVACYEYLIRAKLAGVNVVAVNDSWGPTSTSAYDSVLDYVVNQAGKAGVLSVFSAGNDGVDSAEEHTIVMLQSPYMITVAASNEDNALASWSNYNATGVDLAAPGCKILSTLPDSMGTTYFNALLSHRSGTYDAKTNPNGKADKLSYYTDIASLYNAGVVLALLGDTSGNVLADQSALTVSTSDANGTPYTCRGEDAVKITIDYDKVRSAGVDPQSVGAMLMWGVDNVSGGVDNTSVFYGRTDLDPADYTVNVTSEAVDFDENAMAIAYSDLRDAKMSSLSKNMMGSIASKDGCGEIGGTLKTIDANDPVLYAVVKVGFMSSDKDMASSGTYSCLVTGFGVGRSTDPTADSSSAYSPYDFLFGTSMAAPEVTGAVGELASLYPNESALQLRGRICGGTELLASEADQAKVASGGRLSFDAAVDSSKVNANTWSITTSGDQVTVHGYNLDGAKLYVDDTSHTGTPAAVGTQAGSIAFTASSSLLDGKAHRFDVVDANGRSYDASYTTPEVSHDSFTRIQDLPTSRTVGKGTLVSSTDRLFYADVYGTFLYSNANPSDPSSTWTSLAASGSALTGASKESVEDPCYAYANGKLYAFVLHRSSGQSDTTQRVAVVCDVYDIATNSWSGFREIWSQSDVKKTALLNLHASSCGGTVCCFLRHPGSDAVIRELLTLAPGADSFRSAIVDHGTTDYPIHLLPVAGSLYGISMNPTTAGTPKSASLAKLDPATAAFSLVGELPGYGTMDDNDVDEIEDLPQAAVGGGFVIAGQSATNLGDFQLIGSDASVTRLGSFGSRSSSGSTVSSMSMLGGRLYLDCVDVGDGSKVHGLFTLPQAAASKLSTDDVTVRADATAGGSATVSDWRDSAASTLDVREGDTATWTATAETGHAFLGWYSGDTLVSTDATYSVPANEAQALTARFSAINPESPTTPASASADGSVTTPVTGDATPPTLPVALLGLALAALGVKRLRDVRG